MTNTLFTLYNHLIGPTLPLNTWSWNDYGSPIQSGTTSFQTPNYLIGNGSYSSTINTGHCEAESDPLEYTLKECDICDIDLEIEEIFENEPPICSFTYNIVIYSLTSYTASFTDDFNNVAINPSTFAIVPGPNYIPLTVTPQGSFSGTTYWTIQGTVIIDGVTVDCIYEFQVEIPPCGNSDYFSRKMEIGDSANPQIEDLLNIYPNPAKDVATVYYEISSSEGALEIYDLSGRSVANHNLLSAKGEVPLNTGKYQAGIYIVVLRQSNGYTMQQKLIIE